MPHHTTPHHTYTPTTTKASVDVVVVEDAINALRARNIASPEELMPFASPQAVLGACRWWDTQKSAGTGMLAKVIREGGMPDWRPRRSMLDEQQEYGQQICDWLGENFPTLCDDRWGPHPAAIAAVIKLHYAEGKGSLRKGTHGPVIRAAVKAWDDKWGDDR